MKTLGMTTMTGKIVASVAVLGSAAAVAGLGTFGTFTSSTSASTSAATGTVSITLGAAGTAANRLTLGATGLVPTDSMQRAVDLINNGNQNLASISLTTNATTSSLLDTDATNGLQMKIDNCSTTWVEAGTSPAFTYTCTGTQTAVLASVPVVQANAALTNLGSLTNAATDHLRVTLTLPTTADNTFQNKTSAINFTFNAIQRAGTNK
jgi:spore coat-associated protein N